MWSADFALSWISPGLRWSLPLSFIGMSRLRWSGSSLAMRSSLAWDSLVSWAKIFWRFFSRSCSQRFWALWAAMTCYSSENWSTRLRLYVIKSCVSASNCIFPRKGTWRIMRPFSTNKSPVSEISAALLSLFCHKCFLSCFILRRLRLRNTGTRRSSTSSFYYCY